jgi:hypothetical protein
MPKPRKELQWFVEEHMERRLKEHDGKKRHWKNTAPAYLVDQLGKSYEKLCGAVRVMLHDDDVDPVEDTQTILDKTADVANYAMMVADNAREAVLGALEGALEHSDDWDESEEPKDIYFCDDCIHPHGSAICMKCKARKQVG